MNVTQIINELLKLPAADLQSVKKRLDEISEENGLLNLPTDTQFPFFAYGLLKPGEIAHTQIQPYIEKSEPFSLPGALYVRDGLPLFDYREGTEHKLQGSLIQFKSPDAHSAYSTICKFEPKKHYDWHVVDVGGLQINCLVGKWVDNGSILLEDDKDWHSSHDPLFNQGLEAVAAIVASDGQDAFGSDMFLNESAWQRFFRLSMAYLLLWSILERFSALKFGPSLKPNQSLKRFGDDPDFAKALKDCVTETRTVFDSRNPKDKCHLDRAKSQKSIQYYYAVRSNMSHRGKSAWGDGETVRKSLSELLSITRAILKRTTTT